MPTVRRDLFVFLGPSRLLDACTVTILRFWRIPCSACAGGGRRARLAPALSLLENAKFQPDAAVDHQPSKRRQLGVVDGEFDARQRATDASVGVER